MRHSGLGICFFALLLAACRAQEEPPPVARDRVDWAVAAANLRDEVARAAAQHAAAAAEVRDSNLPLASLEIEKIELRLAETFRDQGWEAAQQRSADLVHQCLERLAAGQVAHRQQTGAEAPEGYFHRAYYCRTDGSPQPYYLRLPADYDPARAWPVIIFLHGYVTETSKIDPWVLPSSQWQMATDRGFIFCLPHGRRNSDFLGIGEVDTLRVIEELQRFYHVDPERIFLTGCSMGGYGGWAIGLRQPDRFAALGLMSGQTDFFTWERRDRNAVRFKSWCILQNNPLDLAVNAQHLPMYLQHGARDPLVPVIHSRLIVPVLEQLGYAIKYDELADQGHYLYWDDPPFERLFDFLRPLKRVAPPAQVRFKTFTPKQGAAYWVDVRKLQRWGPAAEVEAAIAEEALSVTASNVAELWLDPPAERIGPGLTLTVNGQPAGRVAPGPHLVRIGSDGKVAPALAARPPAERPRTGPAREVFNDRFLVTYATGGGSERRAHNQAQAERFRQLWWAFAEGLAPLAADTELTADQVRDHNLVIFGEPEAVTLAGIADPAAMLPAGVTMAPGRYTVGQRVCAGDDLGMVLLAPHPLDPRRLILWWSGATYGERLPVNHQFDLIPDLLVYKGGEFADDGTNQFVVGGFLSPDWQLDDRLLDYAQP